MTSLANYSDLQQLSASATTLVYRARRSGDGHPVILKLLQDTYPSPGELDRFRREYERLQELKLPGIVRANGLYPHQNGLLMELEDIGGVSLDRAVPTGMAPDDFLPLAIDVAAILDRLHRRGFIHKDIHPGHIVRNPEDGRINLIDLGTTTVLPRENAAARPPGQLEGTLATISPEQTGRMNRTPDQRSDLYALGATFHWLLTGRFPFEDQSPIALIHSHIAALPTPPHHVRPEIPESLSAIVMKLLAKEPEERYQSAHGLAEDLQTCRTRAGGDGAHAPFPLGRKDVPVWFRVSDRLVGREAESKALQAEWEPVREGARNCLLVSGPTGIGKSRLVQWLQRHVVESGGVFVSGKFEQQKNALPFAPMLHALQALVRECLTEDEVRVTALRDGLQEVLGENGAVLTGVIPELERIIGPQRPVPDLPPLETRNRFNTALTVFLKIIAGPHRPVTIFLDDLQWADASSLNQLRGLLIDSDVAHLLLIGACRDNEVGIDHPLTTLLNDLDENGVRCRNIPLNPLSLEDINQLLVGTLSISREAAAPLTGICMNKTRGNPFFLRQFLDTLHADGLIGFQDQSWHWDEQAIRGRNITDNVVDLMKEKILDLSPEAQRVLKTAACMNVTIDPELLALATGLTRDALDTCLGEARNENLLIHEQVRHEGSGSAARFRFVHDQIQHAAYLLIPLAEREQVHLEIGRALSGGTPADRQPGHLYIIAQQLNSGRRLISDGESRIDLARLNLRVGRETLYRAAAEPAYRLLSIARELIGETGWETCHDLALAIHTNLAQAALLNGDHEWTRRWVRVVVDHAATPLERAQALIILIRCQTVENRMADSVGTALEALAALGFALPARPSKPRVLRALSAMLWTLHRTPPDRLARLPNMTDPHHLAAMEVIGKMTQGAVMTAQDLLPLILSLQIRLTVQHGIAPSSTSALAVFGYLQCAFFNRTRSGYAYGHLAMELSKRFPNDMESTRCKHVFYSFIQFFRESWQVCAEASWNAFLSWSNSGGSLSESVHSLFSYHIHQFIQGSDLAVVEQKMAAHQAHFVRSDETFVLEGQMLFRQTVLNLLGRPDDACRPIGDKYARLAEAGIPEDRQLAMPTLTYLYCQLWWSTLFQRVDDAYRFALAYERLGETLKGSPTYYPSCFMSCLGRLWLIPAAGRIQRRRLLRQVDSRLDKLRRWAVDAPMNFANKVHLVEAERWRVLGQADRCGPAYERAIALAREHGLVHEEALTLEMAGRFHLEEDRLLLAGFFLRQARHAYRRWGAAAKVRDLEERYPNHLDLGRIPGGSPAAEAVATPIDLPTLLKASEAVFGATDPDELLKRLISLAIENAGARRGVLALVEEPGGPLILRGEGRVGQDGVAVLPSLPVDSRREGSFMVPSEILRLSSRSGEEIVLADARQDARFSRIPYVRETAVRSVLCAPLIRGKQVEGVLYLEHDLACGAFTGQRVATVRMLGTMAAISIANARMIALRVERELLKKESVALRQAKEAAEQANAEKSRFLAAVSHDLRQPLAAESLFLEGLKKHVLAPEVGALVANIRSANQNLTSLFHGLLDLSKLDAGGARPQVVVFRLDPLLQRLHGEFRIKTAAKGLTFSAVSTSAVVRSDPLLLERVLRNLLSNAIRYTWKGGVVMGCRRCQAGFRIEVWDSGPGIPEAEREVIFKEFYRLDHGKGQQDGGMGLGLSIVKKIAGLLDHPIRLSSVVGRGSCFGLVVPEGLEEGPDGISRPPAASTALPGFQFDGQRIFVIDDDAQVVEGLRSLLTGWGCRVDAASDIEAALDTFEQIETPPDVIICDLDLGSETTGIDLIKRLRESEAEIDLPALIITGNTDPELTRTAEAEGMPMLHKPIHPSQLRATLTRLMRGG